MGMGRYWGGTVLGGKHALLSARDATDFMASGVFKSEASNLLGQLDICFEDLRNESFRWDSNHQRAF
jgi:hypothetical protein